MFGRSDHVQNLKLDILDLKKELTVSKETNQLLKVKIRKLENEVAKRDRQIETLLDPRKSGFVHKLISDRGASVVLNLQERNLHLQKILAEKEFVIRRLQSGLQTQKLYSGRERKRNTSKQRGRNVSDMDIPYNLTQNLHNSDSEEEDDLQLLERNFKSISMHNINQGKENRRSRSATHRTNSETPRTNSGTHRTNSAERTISHHNNIKASYDGLSKRHLLSIIECLKDNQRRLSPRVENMESSDRSSTSCDTPHQEIQQLQNYFMDMLSEVDQLKATIVDLKSDQVSTVRLLKEKDKKVGKLVNEVESLKKPKSETKCPSVYSSFTFKKGQMHPVKSVKTAQMHGCMKPVGRARNEDEEEKEINTCSYMEMEQSLAEQTQGTVHVIQTRTIGIQKFENASQYKITNKASDEENYYKTFEEENLYKAIDEEILSKATDEENLQNSEEEETRKTKFNNLLEQMLEKSAGENPLASTIEEVEEDIPTEYI